LNLVRINVLWKRIERAVVPDIGSKTAYGDDHVFIFKGSNGFGQLEELHSFFEGDRLDHLSGTETRKPWFVFVVRRSDLYQGTEFADTDNHWLPGAFFSTQ